MIILLNVLLVLGAILLLYIGVRVLIRFKSKGLYLFLTLLILSFLSIGLTEIKTTTVYQEPAALMVKNGTLVVIDSNKTVHIVNDYESGLVCVEIRHHKRTLPIFNESFVSINTKCQNLLK